MTFSPFGGEEATERSRGCSRGSRGNGTLALGGRVMSRMRAVPLLFAVVLGAAPTAAQSEEPKNPCSMPDARCLTAGISEDLPGICRLTTCIYVSRMPSCQEPYQCARCLGPSDTSGGTAAMGGNAGVAGTPDCRSLGGSAFGGTAFAIGGSAPTGGWRQQDWGCDNGPCGDDDGCSVGPAACFGVVAATTTTVPWPMLAMLVLGVLRRISGRARSGPRRER
jgi:hypothetical protein